MPRWRILDGPHQQPVGVHDDFARYVATVENVNDPAQRRFIEVQLSRTVLQSDLTKLPDEVRVAVETNGRTAIERFLAEQDPPAVLAVAPTAIQPLP